MHLHLLPGIVDDLASC